MPVESLRLPLQAVARLRRLGLDTVGQVLAMPRESLSSRFGPSLARRLDQLTGAQPEPLVPLDYDVPIEATMTFDGAIDALETLWLVLRELVGRVTLDLARRGRGARRVEFTCAPDPSSRWPAVVRSVSLAKPSRDAVAIRKLLECASERLDCGDGFTRVRLRVTVHERVGDEQVALLEDVDARIGRDEWGRLVERLSVRLGANNVARPIAVESYVPERAWRAMPITEDVPAAAATLAIAPPRPLTLLPTPAEIRVIAEPSDDWEGRPAQFTHGGKIHRLVDVVGPERIAGEWWRGHHKTRDYYDVRDSRGRRFWLFRVVAPIARAALDGQRRLSTRWFLHGAFVIALAASLTPSPPYPGERGWGEGVARRQARRRLSEPSSKPVPARFSACCIGQVTTPSP